MSEADGALAAQIQPLSPDGSADRDQALPFQCSATGLPLPLIWSVPPKAQASLALGATTAP
jgi:hypothetical protein